MSTLLQPKESNCDSSNCIEIRRMISALIFYSTIDPINNVKHGDKFMEFCKETYPEILDDHIHIMDHHQHDMDKVLQLIHTDFDLMSKCDIHNCQMIVRHYRDKKSPTLAKTSIIDYDSTKLVHLLDTIISDDSILGRSKSIISEYIMLKNIDRNKLLNKPSAEEFTSNVVSYQNDIKLQETAAIFYNKCQGMLQVHKAQCNETEANEDMIFYIDLLDNMHTFWYHSYDLGMRVNINEITEQDSKQNDDDYDRLQSNTFYDRNFARRREIIRNKVKASTFLNSSNRFEAKKFSLDPSKTIIDHDGIW